MNILVCVKVIPSNYSFNEELCRLDRTGRQMELNPPDRHSIDIAVELKSKYGGHITAITMGVKNAIDALKILYAMGIDRVILLNDHVFSGSDTYATSYILSKAIKMAGRYDIIICGRHSMDGSTGQTGPGIAGFLNIPHLCYVRDIMSYEKNNIMCVRYIGTNIEQVKLDTPCLICMDIYEKKGLLPTLKGILYSKNKSVEIWDSNDILVDKSKCGAVGSHTQIKRLYSVERTKKAKIIEGNNMEIARDIVTIISVGSLNDM